MGYSVGQKPQQHPLKVRKARKEGLKTGTRSSDEVKDEIPRSCLLLFGDVKADPKDESDSSDAGNEEVTQLKSEVASEVDLKSESGDESDASSLDDEEELARELAAIRREREERIKEEQQAAAASKQDDLRNAVAAGLREPSNAGDWTEDSVFNVIHREERPKYVNDLVRSDFHRRFLARYIL